MAEMTTQVFFVASQVKDVLTAPVAALLGSHGADQPFARVVAKNGDIEEQPRIAVVASRIACEPYHCANMGSLRSGCMTCWMPQTSSRTSFGQGGNCVPTMRLTPSVVREERRRLAKKLAYGEAWRLAKKLAYGRGLAAYVHVGPSAVALVSSLRDDSSRRLAQLSQKLWRDEVADDHKAVNAETLEDIARRA